MDEHFERSVRRELRALRIYAAATTAVAALALLGAANAMRSASFDVLTVHRIDVVDPKQQDRPRMQLQVAPNGAASLQIFDENGNLTAAFPSLGPTRRSVR
jgi:hypothetical protein